MREEDRLERNRTRLGECHEVFAEDVALVIADLERVGMRPRIQTAWRSPEAQLEALDTGASELKFGFHNVTGATGRKESLAVDLLDDDAPLDPPRHYLLRLAAAARARGLNTGVDWGLSRSARARIARALAREDFDATVKIGWDPCHVEVTGFKPEDARRGRRPEPRAAAAEPDVPPVAARTLLVRRIGGPAQAIVGEPLIYRAEEFNFADPSPAELATINWIAKVGDRTIAEARAGGVEFSLEPAANLAGTAVRVMAFRNSPSPRVSVVTALRAREPATPVVPGSGPTVAMRPVVVSWRRDVQRLYARVDDGPEFLVGSDVRYLGRRGLMNTSDQSGTPYDPATYRGRFGFWADFILPTSLCESGGYFQRLNTYDRAAFTFGFFQHAAHTRNDNFALLLRRLLALPQAGQYFPDLELHDGQIHQRSASGLKNLENDGSDVPPLMAYLNPQSSVVDDIELVNAAKFVHWSQNDARHRDTQVEFTVDQMRKKLADYARRYHLDGIVDTVCLVVADIRHQGRARSSEIIRALASGDAFGELMRIGEDSFPERLRTLRAAIETGLHTGTLGARVYDAASGDFREL